MDFGLYAGDTSKTIYVRLRDSTTGLAKTGLVYNSAGAVCSYTLPGAARAAITLATLASASAAWSSGGFILVDDTNCKGLYRLDLPNAAIASGAFTIISIQFTGVIEESVEIILYVRKVDVDTIKTNPVVNGGTVTFPTNATLASTTNITAGTIATVTTLTNLPAITANWLTAAGTAADFGAELATAIWTDTTAGDFTVALSVGKSVMNGVTLGTGLTVARATLVDTLTTYTGNTVQTGDSFAIVNGASGLVAIKTVDDAIKVTTDKFVFTVANQVNANTLSVSGTAQTAKDIGSLNLSSGKVLVQGTIDQFDDFVSAAGLVTADVTKVAGATQTAGDIAALINALSVYTTRIVARGTAAGTSTTSVTTSAFSPAGIATDQFKGRIIVFDVATSTTALRGQATDITASTISATPTFTVTALTTAPAAGDTFTVI